MRPLSIEFPFNRIAQYFDYCATRTLFWLNCLVQSVSTYRRCNESGPRKALPHYKSLA
jgi:hypothetical protein